MAQLMPALELTAGTYSTRDRPLLVSDVVRQRRPELSDAVVLP